MSIERVTLTPAMASDLMLRNGTNRPMRETRVRNLIADHLNGNFDGRAVHIMVDTEGNLINGQHTCTTVVRTGKPLDHVMIEFGVAPEVADKLDRAQPRNVRDALARRGATNRSNLSAILRLYVAMRDYKNVTWSSLYIPEAELLRTYEAEPQRFDDATLKAMQAYNRAGINRTMYGAFAATVGIESEDWESWHSGVCSGEGLRKGDARLTFREWARKPIARHAGELQQYRIVCITRAWNSWVAHEPINHLMWRGNLLPMPTPVPAGPKQQVYVPEAFMKQVWA